MSVYDIDVLLKLLVSGDDLCEQRCFEALSVISLLVPASDSIPDVDAQLNRLTQLVWSRALLRDDWRHLIDNSVDFVSDASTTLFHKTIIRLCNSGSFGPDRVSILLVDQH